MPTEDRHVQKILSLRDGIAIIAAVGLGGGFAYLSGIAGYAWLIAAGPYVLLVIPCVVIFLAKERKFLVWQVCVLSFGIFVRAKLPGMRTTDTVKMLFVFWALGTILSAPAPAYFFLCHFKGRMRYIAASAIAALAVALWLLTKRITR